MSISRVGDLQFSRPDLSSKGELDVIERFRIEALKRDRSKNTPFFVQPVAQIRYDARLIRVQIGCSENRNGQLSGLTKRDSSAYSMVSARIESGTRLRHEVIGNVRSSAALNRVIQRKRRQSRDAGPAGVRPSMPH